MTNTTPTASPDAEALAELTALIAFWNGNKAWNGNLAAAIMSAGWMPLAAKPDTALARRGCNTCGGVRIVHVPVDGYVTCPDCGYGYSTPPSPAGDRGAYAGVGLRSALKTNTAWDAEVETWCEEARQNGYSEGQANASGCHAEFWQAFMDFMFKRGVESIDMPPDGFTAQEAIDWLCEHEREIETAARTVSPVSEGALLNIVRRVARLTVEGKDHLAFASRYPTFAALVADAQAALPTAEAKPGAGEAS